MIRPLRTIGMRMLITAGIYHILAGTIEISMSPDPRYSRRTAIRYVRPRLRDQTSEVAHLV